MHIYSFELSEQETIGDYLGTVTVEQTKTPSMIKMEYLTDCTESVPTASLLPASFESFGLQMRGTVFPYPSAPRPTSLREAFSIRKEIEDRHVQQYLRGYPGVTRQQLAHAVPELSRFLHQKNLVGYVRDENEEQAQWEQRVASIQKTTQESFDTHQIRVKEQVTKILEHIIKLEESKRPLLSRNRSV